ncbi:hypothetical protein D3C71_1967350 [compost metagenome]
MISPALAAPVPLFAKVMSLPAAFVRMMPELSEASAAVTPVFEDCSLIAATALDKPSDVFVAVTLNEIA